VKELSELRENNEDFQLIDVREQYEYDIAHIDGELVPLGQVPSFADKISKDRKVVVYCRSGIRSAQAIRVLEKKHGFDNLYNLKGGILAWADEIDPSIPKY
jgi:adenylyltransferase/sulfurtransferase